MSNFCDSVFDDIKITDAEVEEVTRTQAASSVWHDQRCGRVTASVAGQCCKTDMLNPAASLL